MRLKPSIAAALAALCGAALIQPAAQADGPPAPAPGTHLMLDTASAPPLPTVQRWQQASPYSAIAVYLPVNLRVDNRHDKVQANLTADWVQAVRAGGWQVLPIYLGLQAPQKCDSRPFHYLSNNATKAAQQGREAAVDAVGAAQSLGITAGAPIVYDMEAYASGCSKAMRAFYDGWTTKLHALGRQSGVYGSRNSTITDVAALPAHGQAVPDAVWVATASGQAQTASLPPLADGTWPGKRLNQFNLGVTRNYGGVSINVDESAVDDAVWDITAPTIGLPPAATATTRSSYLFDWTGSDIGGSGVARYEIRTRDGGFGRSLGRWSKPTKLGHNQRRVRLSTGEQWCAQVRATDRAGNRSRWSRPTCTARFADDRSLHAAGRWHRSRNGHAYQHTASVARHKGLTLSTGTARFRSVGVLLHGAGTVEVLIGHRKVGTLSGSGLLWLHLATTHHGTVRLRTVSHAKVAVDGLALLGV